MRDSSFYLPSITTLDVGLLDAIRSCPLRAVLIHDDGALVETLFDDEFDFQRTLTNRFLIRLCASSMIRNVRFGGGLFQDTR